MANQHFFKPLLPGFHNHLTIPTTFFFKHIHRKSEEKMAKLRTDVSKITWEVKVEDGRRLSEGWKEFALAHDLRVGDIVVFRKEKDMTFHVVMFGPSCCEIRYGSCLDNKNNLGKIQRKKKSKKNARRETGSSLDPSCFVANVTPLTIQCDRLNLPSSFVRKNGFDTRRGEIVIMNEKGTSWTLDLKGKNSHGVTYISRGWRSFCHANGLKAGDRGSTLVLCLSPKESEEDCSSEANDMESLSTETDSDVESSKEKRSSHDCSTRNENKGMVIWKASSSTSENQFVTVTLTPYNIRLSRLVLPIPFTRVNGIKRTNKMSLLDKHGVKWSTNLRFEEERKRMRIVGGWKEFCDTNGVKIGES
ncbi:unnamed protein product, partial [Thlaspi arvense]